MPLPEDCDLSFNNKWLLISFGKLSGSVIFLFPLASLFLISFKTLHYPSEPLCLLNEVFPFQVEIIFMI